MILICASCATRYYADDASIGPEGRSVRCAACGHTWFVGGQLVLGGEEAAPLAHFVDAPAGAGSREAMETVRQAARNSLSAAAQVRQRRAERQRRERARAALIAWAGSGGALVAGLLAAIALRQDVARAWPQTASAYAAIGLPVNVTGLEFADIQVDKDAEGAAPALVVRGAVRNIGPTRRAPPVLRFSLRDEEGEEMVSWLAPLEGRPIAPGGARPFRSRLESPPEGAADLEASFASAAEIAAFNAAAPAQSVPEPAEPAGEAPGSAEPAKHGSGHRPSGGPLEPLGGLLSPAEAADRPVEGLAPRLPAETRP